jgi:hypothetical protein
LAFFLDECLQGRDVSLLFNAALLLHFSFFIGLDVFAIPRILHLFHICLRLLILFELTAIFVYRSEIFATSKSLKHREIVQVFESGRLFGDFRFVTKA